MSQGSIAQIHPPPEALSLSGLFKITSLVGPVEIEPETLGKLSINYESSPYILHGRIEGTIHMEKGSKGHQVYHAVWQPPGKASIVYGIGPTPQHAIDDFVESLLELKEDMDRTPMDGWTLGAKPFVEGMNKLLNRERMKDHTKMV